MATAKSMKIQAEIDKVKAKISEQQARLKELEKNKQAVSYTHLEFSETYHSNMARRRVLTLLLTSLAPIPFATVPNREIGHMGQNYFRSLFAVGFQGLLILVCVAIYAVLIQSIATDGDPIGAIWGCVG